MFGDAARRGMRPGLTLVEAAVALVILSVTLLAGLESTARALQAQRDAERHREAAAVAEWKLNQLATMTADSLRHFAMPRSGDLTLDGARYRWQAVARPRPESPRLWEVAVGVEWDDRRVMLETRLYRRSPPGFGAP